jgi:hypothetical protein
MAYGGGASSEAIAPNPNHIRPSYFLVQLVAARNSDFIVVGKRSPNLQLDEVIQPP